MKDELISRENVLMQLDRLSNNQVDYKIAKGIQAAIHIVEKEPCKENMKVRGMCHNCKYFKYDMVQNVAGMPFIVAHELCTKWGEGCKTSVDGYCFLFEKKEGGAAE